ncbi:O-antigen ligase [Leptospira fainei serovar Hurstbridge str. BUT 6]|uniref:O-antigen ligase n=1 Tax=Leptospira fainei serovar Hurstbridge str. BUT 6 TaxID=1193011 RepID=S3V2I0_9LEPT|nr:O-antigen ligase family protein [Leptospira fainei]EPG75618.1 O-antigen ligase [Leptospira fainei serovar Hurstbridge str. BUT 6]
MKVPASQNRHSGFQNLTSIAVRGSFYSFLLFLSAFPLSVSISQVFAGLSIFFFLLSGPSHWQKIRPFLVPWSFILIAYFLVFLSSLIHIEEYARFWRSFTRESEAGDFWLSFLFPIGAVHASNKDNAKLLRGFLWSSLVLLLVSGFVSIFSEYRLGKFISNGFQNAPGDRRQHPAGLLFGLQTYLPIGLMNTHLTYGGLLSLYLPGIFANFWESIRSRSLSRFLLFSGTFLISCWIFLLNQSKSAWLGVAFVCLFILLRFVLETKCHLTGKGFLKGILATVLLLTVLGTGIKFLYEQNWLLQRTVSQTLQVQTPENQRYWIYKNSIPLLQLTPFLGVGGGKFKSSHKKISENTISRQEQLWYELEITPNVHAHNDLLQFSIIGGWASALFLVLFFFFLFRRIGISDPDETGPSVIGVGSLWVAGFFQCYLLDDEVVLPFYALAGILFGQQGKKSLASVKFTGIVLLIPFLLNLVFWTFRLRTPTELAYSRQVKSTDPVYAKQLEDRILPFRIAVKERTNRLDKAVTVPSNWGSIPAQIEGCLTHRFPNPPALRKEPFQIGIYIRPEASNPPKEIKIIVVGRESFDEDQLYWSHSQNDLATNTMKLTQGWNKFTWKETSLLQPSPRFPDGVFFRDFKIYWMGYDPAKPMDLPALDFGDLCDFKL